MNSGMTAPCWGGGLWAATPVAGGDWQQFARQLRCIQSQGADLIASGFGTWLAVISEGGEQRASVRLM